MFATTATTPTATRSRLERALSLFTDIRAGEGPTVVLMLANIFLLLVCYSVIKTVREPLILLGGGAEVRSYAAAGQALLLMGLVPLYGWFANRVKRAQLLAGVTIFFIGCIQLFALAVAAGLPFVGVAFFIWVGIFNLALIAQFWSFANDIYTKEAGERLFPIIVIGMTAGAPLGSFVAGRLFRSGLEPQVILQVAAGLLALSLATYLALNRRPEQKTAVAAQPLSAAGGFRLVIGNPYLRLIALLIVLLNVVNTTGEYLVARLLSEHVSQLAAADLSFNKQAYIGAFSGDYQFWVNVTALLLQAFVASRLVKYRGLQGVLLALPLIALGGYAIAAAGVGFSVMRWIKTAENATDYSIMNTARQLLWLPTNREEKYKAKQAIDTFFVRGGDVLSAGVVFLGAGVLRLTVEQFAMANVVLTLAWLAVAIRILEPHKRMPRIAMRPLARATAVVGMVAVTAAPALAQESREQQLAQQQAEKAADLHSYVPSPLERKLERVDGMLKMLNTSSIYPFIGSAYDGGGLALGPGYRGRFADTGRFDVHAGVSIKSYKTTDATLTLPSFANDKVRVALNANWLDAPKVAFYGGNESLRESRSDFAYNVKTIGVTTTVSPLQFFNIGAGLDVMHTDASLASGVNAALITASPNYRRARVFAEVDTRTSPGYTRRGGLYRAEFSNYSQSNGTGYEFRRFDAEARQFIPLLRENWIIALRAMASTTSTPDGQDVPYFMLPELGGSHWLRGYPTWRFRDRNRVLMTGEYRWTAGNFVDMAVFLDAGKVAARASELDLDGWRKTYGIGMNVHTLTSTVMRIEFAKTAEGKSLLFSFSPSF
jgi:AAA family ATP:ADP antiporter